MRTFKSFLTETAMSASFNENRGTRHVKNYILPFLSSAGKKKTVKAFSNVQSPLRVDHSTDGEHYNPEADHTHVLEKSHAQFPAGTPIKITHVSHKDGVILAHTESHGAIPISKISKPKGLKKERQGSYGFDVEAKVAKNLGLQKAAGSSNQDRDFEIGGAKGSVKIAGEEQKPSVRGESKLEKGRMGVTTLTWEKKGGWRFAGNPKMHKKFAEARVVGEDGRERSLLGHLNTHHGDGLFAKGKTIKAPPGTSREYLDSGDINCLHIHDKKTQNSSTFTVGDTHLRGTSGLSHLSHGDIDSLDGKISLEPSGVRGKIRIAHSPNIAKMRECASRSAMDPENHKTLENPGHAVGFLKKLGI